MRCRFVGENNKKRDRSTSSSSFCEDSDSSDTPVVAPAVAATVDDSDSADTPVVAPDDSADTSVEDADERAALELTRMSNGCDADWVCDV